MDVPVLPRKVWQRALGICATRAPGDAAAWSVAAGRILVDVDRVPELGPEDSAVRLEGRGLPERILLVHGADGGYRAYVNRCGHGGRRLDPVPGTGFLQCCSMGKSTYEAGGAVVSGPASRALEPRSVTVEGTRIEIALS